MKVIVKISELDSARVLFKDMTQRVEPPSCRICFLLDLVQQIYALPQRERPVSRRKLVEDHLTFLQKKQICNGLSYTSSNGPKSWMSLLTVGINLTLTL